VAVLENEEAVFKSVSEIPFQQLTQTQQGGQIGTTSFKEAGITLIVTPKIAADGTIMMMVSPEFSRLAGFTPGDNQPIIDTRRATTTLVVANRQTIVIGGLRERRDIGDFNGVPYLKDIKGLGRLFRSRDTDVRESELVVFISPEIISYGDEPTLRQQMAADTIRCRLDQIPEAEGCPPCCRRLPPNATDCDPTVGAPAGETAAAGGVEAVPSNVEEIPVEALPPPPVEMPPMSADEIPSAEFQFGSAGRHEHVQALLAEGRLRRLPSVERVEQSAPSGGEHPLRMATSQGVIVRPPSGLTRLPAPEHHTAATRNNLFGAPPAAPSPAAE
jgi:general secretion pathway protein D